MDDHIEVIPNKSKWGKVRTWICYVDGQAIGGYPTKHEARRKGEAFVLAEGRRTADLIEQDRLEFGE